jgi:hypothetical protein
MNGIRRALILAGLTLAVIIGASIPAFAGFSDSVTVAPRLTTATVNAPGNVGATTACYGSTLYASITWQRSSTARVSGYRISASVPGQGQVLEFTAAPTATRYDASMGRVWQSFPVEVTVTTLTEYGWTKAANPVTVTTC